MEHGSTPKLKDTLSEKIVEALRNQGLYHFTLLEKSTNDTINLLVYENEKYRYVLREWGSAIGIHIFPPIDRRPLTDDKGKHVIK